jgi:phosphoglycerol transferase MdoB-like AlkP superfamily enzyme
MINYRSLLVDKTLGAYTSCQECYRLNVLNADAMLYLALITLVYASTFLKKYLIRLILKTITILLISYYLLDIYIFKFLNQRLYFNDIATYFDLDTIIEGINRETNNHSFIFTITFFGLLAIYIFLHRSIQINKIDKALFVLLLVPGVYLLTNISRIDYVNDVYLRNVIAVNLEAKEAVNYSPKTQVLTPAKVNEIEQLICVENGLNTKKNIILLIVESLSSYQSLLHSGLNDWTPKLDQLARENSYYSNFFANNFTSLEGRIALLTGEKTFRGISNFTNRGFGREGYWNTQRNLPELLSSYGYQTSFLDGANLEFSNTGKYMNGLGFDYVEGSDYSGYEGKKRFGFNSVTDVDLYERVLEYIKQQQQPFFSTIITVSTHAPYVDPDTGQLSIELATKYADKAVFEFYKDLEQQDFFTNGILIITSDHRSMTPVAENELSKFGQQAVSRIPLIIIDKNRATPQVHEQYLQQSDLLNSIEYLVSENHCYRSDEGNLFSNPPNPAQCIYHSRGDYRERVDVYCQDGKQQAVIELNGDNSQVIDGELSDEKEVLDFITYSRLGAIKRHEVYLEKQADKL